MSDTQAVIKKIYNVALGREADYTLTVDENNEILARCIEDGSFLKFPNVSEEEVDALIAKENQEAVRQVVKQPLFGKKEEVTE